MSDENVKLFFTLVPDEEGYPPFSVESVWGKLTAVAGQYVIENIPFFTREATLGDVVHAVRINDRLEFRERHRAQARPPRRATEPRSLGRGHGVTTSLYALRAPL